jgi:hypothetical protein
MFAHCGPLVILQKKMLVDEFAQEVLVFFAAPYYLLEDPYRGDSRPP